MSKASEEGIASISASRLTISVMNHSSELSLASLSCGMKIRADPRLGFGVAAFWSARRDGADLGYLGSRLVEEEALWCRGRMVTHLTPIKALQQWRPEGGRSRSLSPTRQYGRWRATPRRNESLRCRDGYAGEM